MSLKLVTPLGPIHNADGAAFASFTTFQDVSPTPLPLLPQQSMEAGCDIWIRAQGEFSTTGTPTLSIGFWFNTASTVLAQSSTITTGSAAASWPWIAEWEGTLRTATPATGASFNGQGKLYLGTALTTFATPVPLPITLALRTVTVDTSAARAIGVGAAWGTSNASNSIKVNRLRVLLGTGP